MIRLIYDLVSTLLSDVITGDIEYALPDNVRQQEGVGMWVTARLLPLPTETRVAQEELEATVWLTFRGKRAADVEQRMMQALMAIYNGLPATAADAVCEVDLLGVETASIDLEPVSQPVRGVVQLKLTGYISWRV